MPAPDLAARGAGVARRLDRLGEVGLGGRHDRQLIVERLGFGRTGESRLDVGQVVTESPQLLVHPHLPGDRLLDGRGRLLQGPVRLGQAPFRPLEVRRAPALRQGVDPLSTHGARGSHGQLGRQRLDVRFDALPVELSGVSPPVAARPLLGGACRRQVGGRLGLRRRAALQRRQQLGAVAVVGSLRLQRRPVGQPGQLGLRLRHRLGGIVLELGAASSRLGDRGQRRRQLVNPGGGAHAVEQPEVCLRLVGPVLLLGGAPEQHVETWSFGAEPAGQRRQLVDAGGGRRPRLGGRPGQPPSWPAMTSAWLRASAARWRAAPATRSYRPRSSRRTSRSCRLPGSAWRNCANWPWGNDTHLVK